MNRTDFKEMLVATIVGVIAGALFMANCLWLVVLFGGG